MYYKVLWADDSSSWLPEKHVSDVATDIYWLGHEKAKARKERHQKTKQQ